MALSCEVSYGPILSRARATSSTGREANHVRYCIRDGFICRSANWWTRTTFCSIKAWWTDSAMSACVIRFGRIAFCSPEAWRRGLSPQETYWRSIWRGLRSRRVGRRPIWSGSSTARSIARRPDVVAVVHSHSPAVVPFSVVTGTKLRPICHMCGFLGAGTPVFEIRDFAGPGSDLLISDTRLGAALAQSLGQGAGGIDAWPRINGGGKHLAPGGIPGGIHGSRRTPADGSDEARDRSPT